MGEMAALFLSSQDDVDFYDNAASEGYGFPKFSYHDHSEEAVVENPQHKSDRKNQTKEDTMAENLNLDLYNRVRTVPKEAMKEIRGGRLKGMTDINPMWRIKKLTEEFGPCGIGWKPEIVDKRIIPGYGDEQVATVDINLYVKVGDQWSDAIPGTGGSAFVAREKNGPFTSDEAFKMAFTDAISVACKLLGFAADVYWDKDRTKYDVSSEPTPPPAITHTCQCCGKKIVTVLKNGEVYKTADAIIEYGKKTYNQELCWQCLSELAKKHKALKALENNNAAPDQQ